MRSSNEWLARAALCVTALAAGCEGELEASDSGAPIDVFVPPGVDAAIDAPTVRPDVFVPPGVDAAIDALEAEDAGAGAGPTCEEPPPPTPLVTIACTPIDAPPSCTAGPHTPVLRWSFDPASPMDDAIGTRDVARGLVALADSSAVGGGFAFVDADDVPQTSGTAAIVPSGSAVTLEMLLRFRTPLDWHGSAGAGTGGRTQLLNLTSRAGEMELTFEREEIAFNIGGAQAEFTMREGGVASWAAIADGAFHHVAFVFTPRGADLEVVLSIDGESPAVFTSLLASTSLPSVNVVSFGRRSYDPQGIDVDELGLYAEALPATMIAQHAREAAMGMPLSSTDACAPRTCVRPTSSAELVPQLQAPGYDPAHLYAPSTSPTTQYETAPLPGHKRGHTMPRFVASWITSYLANGDDPDPLTREPTAHQLEADTHRAPMADELARHWNYGLGAALSGEANSRPDTNPYVRLLRTAPAGWPIDVGTGGADEGRGRLGLVNASGARVGLSPGDSLAAYRSFGATRASQLAALESRIGRPIDVYYMDFEGESFTTFETARDATVLSLAANATARADCMRRSLAFRPCLAAAITDYRNAMAEGAVSMLSRPPAVHYYEVDGNEEYRGDFAYTRLQNDPLPPRVDPRSDGSDAYRPSTSSLYPLNPSRLYETIGASHGLLWLFEARAYEIAHGARFAMPYVAAGWSYDEHTNIRPPQWLGFLELVGVTGALATVPAFFVIPSAVGSGSCSWGVCNDATCMGDATCLAQTVQNSNHRAWQALAPSYAQGALSHAEDLLRDPASVWLGELPTSGPHVVGTARRLGDRFLVGVMLLVNGNDTARFARTRSTAWVGLDHDGMAATPPVALRLEARVQGSLYVYDHAARTLVQLDRWHDVTHPSRWPATFDREAEVSDASSDLVVGTDASGAATGDYTQFDSFVRVVPARAAESFGTSSDAPHLELDVESRAGGAYAVWVRARTTRDAGSVTVRVGDGAPIELGCVSGAAWQWVRLDCGSASPSSVTLEADVRTTLRVAPSHGGVEIDRVVLTPETSCFAAAVDCACR
ncbi:MAG: hypothetical protein J0L92_29010 [Deltaproteobacteria bacterium]|nr:hypothetical protein [Deltaproteobacteria bacterium]